MARDRSESIDSESTWGEEFGENVVSSNHFRNHDPGDEIMVEGRNEGTNNTSQSPACHNGLNTCFKGCGRFIRSKNFDL